MPEEDIDAFLRRTGRGQFLDAPAAPAAGEGGGDSGRSDITKSGVAMGGLQGLLDLPEALLAGGQWMSSRFDPEVHDPNKSPIASALRKGSEFADYAESLPYGMVSRLGGNFLTGYGEEAALGRFLGRAPTTLRALARRAATGAAEGATSRPSEDYNQFLMQTGMGAAGQLLKGGAAYKLAKDAEAKAAAEAFARGRAGYAGRLKSELAFANRSARGPAAQSRASNLAEEYSAAVEEARQAKQAIPKAPEGMWGFLDKLSHPWKLKIAQWLMSATPPRGAAAGVGEVKKQLENPQ